MKDLIFNSLKAKFEGVNEAVLIRLSEKIAKTVTKEEEIAAAVEKLTVQQVIDSEADRRATEASQTAVANYEKKHSLKEGKQIEKQGGESAQKNNEPTGGNAQNPDNADPANNNEFSMISQTIQALQAEIEAMKASKISDVRKEQLSSALAGSSEKFQSRITSIYTRMNFKDDEDFNSFIDEIKSDAEEDRANTAAAGAVFGSPKFGQANLKDEVPKEIMDVFTKESDPEGQAF